MPRTLVLALLLISAALIGCSSQIVHDLDEAEANQILAVLLQHGIAAEKLRSVEGNHTTYTIQVGRSQASGAWQLLRQENLPRPKPPGVSELFGKPGLVPTATQERTLMHHALAGELSRTLQALDGVLEARVHLVLPSRDPLTPPDAPAPSPRASVLLRLVSSNAKVDQHEVQRLVAGSVEGLRPEAVTVAVSCPSLAQSAPGAPAALVRLGPFQVSAESRPTLRGLLVVVAAILIVLCLAVILLARRQRELQRRLASPPIAQPAVDAISDRLETSLGLLSRSLAARPGSRTDQRAERDEASRLVR